ncbi:unnamed protein product, partial [Ixodes pacificus]
MAKLLGCRVHETNYESLQPTFEHPTRPTEEVHFIFDACRALKLLRNLLLDKKVFRSAVYGLQAPIQHSQHRGEEPDNGAGWQDHHTAGAARRRTCGPGRQAHVCDCIRLHTQERGEPRKPAAKQWHSQVSAGAE